MKSISTCLGMPAPTCTKPVAAAVSNPASPSRWRWTSSKPRCGNRKGRTPFHSVSYSSKKAPDRKTGEDACPTSRSVAAGGQVAVEHVFDHLPTAVGLFLPDIQVLAFVGKKQ